jgi:hypothetical protein
MQIRNLPFTCSIWELGALNVKSSEYSVGYRVDDYLDIEQQAVEKLVTLKDFDAEIKRVLESLPSRAMRYFDKFHKGKREVVVIANFNSAASAFLGKALKMNGFTRFHKYAGFHGWDCETWMKTMRLQ